MLVSASAMARAVDFNFNGWGGRQAHRQDARLAAWIAARSGTSVVQSSLVLEGGGIEVDGEGTAIVKESCVLNANRNPGQGKAVVELALKANLGLTKIVWLPGPVLRASTDAKGRPLVLTVIPVPTEPSSAKADTDSLAAGYINYYLCNGGLILPALGDKAADRFARDALQALYPQRRLVQWRIDALAGGGGGIHCTTQQQPVAKG